MLPLNKHTPVVTFRSNTLVVWPHANAIFRSTCLSCRQPRALVSSSVKIISCNLNARLINCKSVHSSRAALEFRYNTKISRGIRTVLIPAFVIQRCKENLQVLTCCQVKAQMHCLEVCFFFAAIFMYKYMGRYLFEVSEVKSEQLFQNMMSNF